MKVEPHGMGPVAFIPETAFEAYTLKRLVEWGKVHIGDVSKPNHEDIRYVACPWSDTIHGASGQ